MNRDHPGLAHLHTNGVWGPTWLMGEDVGICSAEVISGHMDQWSLSQTWPMGVNCTMGTHSS